MWKFNTNFFRCVTKCFDRKTCMKRNILISSQRSLSNKDVIALCGGNDKIVKVSALREVIEDTGVRWNDPRLQNMVEGIRKIQTPEKTVTDIPAMERLLDENLGVLSHILGKEMAIPDFGFFCQTLHKIYEKCALNKDGQVACYIPQLARYSPDLWAVSVCTVDGQRFSMGEVDMPFTMQSCSKPFTYGICLEELGPEVVHRFIGHEPSGRNFNEICLDSSTRPHNPMLNSGAIMSCALAATMVESKMSLSEKFDYILHYMKKIAGDGYMGFNNAVFLSERETADRNYSMAYYLKENRCFPPKTNLANIMDLYFQTCSMEITCESLAVMGASLANGGICPTNGERVFKSDSIRNILSLMYTCGMYDYSGEFAFTVGLPAKSGVSGAVMLVIPNVMSIALWSPSLDEKGNSCRGIQFCELLVEKFNFHRFDNLVHSEKKSDPRRSIYRKKSSYISTLLFAANKGDTTAIKRMFLQGVNLNDCDYDGRTALHICASEGHLDCTKFLINIAKVNTDCRDRWGFTPADEARRFEHEDVLNILVK